MAGTTGRSGRRPKPTARKELAGNPGKRALNKEEPVFTPIKGVEPPEWFSEDDGMPMASVMWELTTKELCGQGLLCVTDLAVLERWCVAYEFWRRAVKNIARDGLSIVGAMGGKIKNPELTAKKEQESVTGDTMHRIDTPTAQKDKFGAGKNGFTRGNPQTGTPATDLDDDYFDMLQEELAGVVEATGVSLDKSKHNQLLTALKSLLLSRGHPFADIKSDGAAAVDEALSNLGLKSAAKRDVGTGTNQIPDMNSFTSGPGWMKFPSGRIIQYGYQPSSSSGSVIINFPIPFPTQCFGVTGAGTDAGAANIAGCQVIDKYGFYLSAWLVAAGSVFNRTATNISWIAIGI